jgi:hypothetical protein
MSLQTSAPPSSLSFLKRLDRNDISALLFAADAPKFLCGFLGRHELTALFVTLGGSSWSAGFFNWLRFFTAPYERCHQ